MRDVTVSLINIKDEDLTILEKILKSLEFEDEKFYFFIEDK